MPPSFFESICVQDGCPRLLELHQERIQRTLEAREGKLKLSLGEFFSSLSLPSRGVFKVRVDYDKSGRILSHVVDAYTPRMIQKLALVECPNLDYSVKSSDRFELEQARLQCPDADDVIITKNGFLTDTSYSNIVLGDGHNWITPSHCLLPGVKRQYLLNTGAIIALPLREQDVLLYPLCSPINAMLNPGDVQIPSSSIIRLTA